MKQVDVPEGASGAWRVERFEVTREGAAWHNMTAPGRGIAPGIYTKLTRSGYVVMSDTPAEMRDHYSAVRAAHGHVLLNGLGLGMVLQAILNKPNVERVTVVELSPDVIALVAPHYQERYGTRLEVVQADAYAYKPAAPLYGAVWHDIWDDLCTDNLPQMTRLKRKYGRRAEWQGCWGEYTIRAAARRRW